MINCESLPHKNRIVVRISDAFSYSDWQKGPINIVTRRVVETNFCVRLPRHARLSCGKIVSKVGCAIVLYRYGFSLIFLNLKNFTGNDDSKIALDKRLLYNNFQ